MLEFSKLNNEVRVYRANGNDEDREYLGIIVHASDGRKGFMICKASSGYLTIAEMKEIVAKSVDI